MMSRVNCSVRTRSSPLYTFRVRGMGISRSGATARGAELQVGGGLHHLVLPVLADPDEVRVRHLLARLDVLAVRPGEVALDGVVLEVDHRLLLVLHLRRRLL